MTRQIVCMLYVVISALGFGSVSGCRDNEQERLPLQPTRRVPEILERIGFSNIPRDPPRFSVSDDTVDAVRATYLRLLEAYTNNQVELMRRIEMTMPLAITGMHQSVLFPLSTTFNRMFNERFLWAEDIRTFPNASELDAFLAANIEAARFSGEVLLSRRDYSGTLLVLDKNMYRQLKRYKQRYVDTGCQEMADCVETYVRKWVSQIESKNGFMRKYMGFDLLLQSPHVLQGSMSEAALLGAVRHHADALVRAGYTPKWLDEDFPLPLMTAEEKTRAMYMKKIAFPPSCVPSPAQSNELLRSVQEVLKVYSERRSKDLMVEIARMPTLITNVTEDVFWDVSLPLWDALYANCYAPKPQNLKEFSSLDEFEEYMEANVVLATYLGNVDSLNFPWDARLLRIDEWMVRMLSQYKDKFAAERKKKFLSSAARYEQRWLTLVESDKGFARTYVRFRLFKAHADTVQERARMARYYVRTLMDLGYTPKWLDEEFPPL